MRKLSALTLALTLALAGCGSSAPDVACTLQYWDGTLGTCLPAGWHALSADQLQKRGVPPEVITGFERDQPVAGQNPIIIVLREPVGAGIDSPTYSISSINAVKALPSYEEIDQKSVTIDDEDVQMHIYSAQPLPEQPKGRFYQVSAVHASAGYTMTAATPLSPESALTDEVELVLSGLTFQKTTE